MNVQKKASLHEKTVQAVAKGDPLPSKKGRKVSPKNSRVTTTTVDPLIRKWLKKRGLRVQDVKVVRADEVILPTDRRFK